MEQINPVDKLIPIIAQAVTEWQAANTAEKLNSKIKAKLDKSSEDITLKLLGFKESWGKWELDHCNGRNGNSAAGEYLKDIQKEAIKEWLSTVKLPTLPTKAVSDLKAKYLHEYKENLRSELCKLAHEKATEDARAILDKLISSNQTVNYMKLMELVNPT